MKQNKIIKKKLIKKPNLKNYKKLYDRFRYKDHYQVIDWFEHGKLNAAYNVISRHADKNKTALFWLDDEGRKLQFTFAQIEKLSNRFANLLKSLGIKKGDRVFFFLPRIPTLYFGILGAIKIGAVVGTLFPAFGENALHQRLKNSSACLLVTNKELNKRVKKIHSKLPSLKKTIIVDNKFDSVLNKYSFFYDPLPVSPLDPAFMLYTSATGNTPVCGIVIPHQALIQQHLTAQWVLDLKKDEVYWCTADPGWVTGVVYGILAPWSLGVTQVVYNGRFSPNKWLEILKDYKVGVWYSAPTAFRLMQKEVIDKKKYRLKSLRHICSVGEALNPATISWALKTFNLPIHDTWWQTETGAIMIANFPSVPIKPGSMGKPVPGVKAFVVDNNGKKKPANKEGNLVFKSGWPSAMTKVWKDKKAYKRYYRNGWYYSGDQVVKDKNGYFWFVGRADDVIKTSGERIGPFEVESALMEHPSVIEVGVIGKPDPVRGQIIKAFIVLKRTEKKNKALVLKLQKFVKERLAGHAYPREIEFMDKLPKNRSGKIVRRLLKAREMENV